MGDIPSVQYRDIEGFPGYRVGDDGSVWTAWAYNGRNPRRLSLRWQRMRPTPDGDGYLGLNLFRNGRATRRKLHQIVLEAFVGPRPAQDMHACHNNGVVADCRVSNLRWDTPSANQRDRLRHGTSQRGSGSGKAKLTESQVFEIRRAISGGQRKRVIAERFGVAPSTISAIARGANWSWLVPVERAS